MNTLRFTLQAVTRLCVTFQEVDECIVTGQNPQSAKAVGEAILRLENK